MNLHIIQLSKSQDRLAECQNILAADEQQRMQRFAMPLLQQKFALTRGMLRFTLAEYLNLPPQSLEFIYNDWGKPFLKQSSLQFNMAHSGDYCVIAVSPHHPVGVDIEQCINTRQPHLDIAQRFFTEAEYLAIKTATDSELLFFHIWTQKEAFLKAIGRGLSFGLDQFEVSTDLSIASVNNIKDPALNKHVWASQSFDCLAGYRLVVTQENYFNENNIEKFTIIC